MPESPSRPRRRPVPLPAWRRGTSSRISTTPLTPPGEANGEPLIPVPASPTSLGEPVVKMDDSASSALLVDQRKVKMSVLGEGALAAPQHDWPEEEVALVHQPRSHRLCSEIGSAHREGEQAVVEKADAHASFSIPDVNYTGSGGLRYMVRLRVLIPPEHP